MKHWDDEFVTDTGMTRLGNSIAVYPPNPAIIGQRCHETYKEYFEMEIIPNSEVVLDDRIEVNVLLRSRIDVDDEWNETTGYANIEWFSLNYVPLTEKIATQRDVIH